MLLIDGYFLVFPFDSIQAHEEIAEPTEYRTQAICHDIEFDLLPIDLSREPPWIGVNIEVKNRFDLFVFRFVKGLIHQLVESLLKPDHGITVPLGEVKISASNFISSPSFSRSNPSRKCRLGVGRFIKNQRILKRVEFVF